MDTPSAKGNQEILRHTQECAHKPLYSTRFNPHTPSRAHTIVFPKTHSLAHKRGSSVHARDVGSYSLLSIFRGGIAGIGSRSCVWVHVCIGVRGTSRAEFVQRAGGTYGPDHQARLSFQVETLQVAHYCIPTHLQHFKPYFSL